MDRETVVSRWCERVAEAAWLLALTLIPLFFNLYSARHFEPDKAAVLRSLALVALTAVLIRAVDRLIARGTSAAASEVPRPSADDADPPPSLWRRLTAVPLTISVSFYSLVFLFTTITSVVPATSLWGSYQRLEGTYTNLSYILIFVAMVAVMRHRVQLERVITISIATSAAVAGYGIIQHYGLDPLPWLGDVTTRVASTMGNAIFIAAYMIMVVPFTLYRFIVGLSEARAAPASEHLGNELLWVLWRGLTFGAGIALLLAMLKFGAVIRTIDYRYWWVLPGAISCATAIWWLLTSGFDQGRGRVPLWPGLVTLGYLCVFGLQFANSSGGGVQDFVSAGTAANAQDWWLWLIVTLGMLLVAYLLAFVLPRRPVHAPRLGLAVDAVAAGFVTLLLLVTTFYTQSRGPWIGLFAGLFVFFTLMLWQAFRHARAREATGLSRLLQGFLILWLTLAVVGGGFLGAFNFSNDPFFERLRDVPYLGRMGRLLEVNEGTGLVRRLIWAGDEHAGGAVALITSDPLRMVIGWGPESMFVAFNRFYPPGLANIEARGASPDRSHQALLDELVNKGILGLASYLFLLLSFSALSWRLIRRSETWAWQLFFIACISGVVSTFFEGLSGIPIVSSLMMFWVTLGLTVVGGAVAGHYRLSAEPHPAPAGVTREEAAHQPAPPVTGAPGRRRTTAVRGQPVRGTRTAVRNDRQNLAPSALLAYALIVAVSLLAVVLLNVNPIRADMRFQQGQSLAQRGNLAPDVLLRVLDDYISTVRLSPSEDFYYLNLGRIMMSLAESKRAQAQGGNLGVPNPTAKVEDLLNLHDQAAIAGWVQSHTANATMSYAEAVLLRAHELNPLNKDHFANLGRLNSYWYRWANDPERLRTSLDWYKQVAVIAPQDVTLLNEQTSVLVDLGNYTTAKGDQAQATDYYQQARTLLEHSRTLDPKYPDTYVRISDLTRQIEKDLDAATTIYLDALSHNPNALNNSIEGITTDLKTRPDLLLKLREAYTGIATTQEADLATAAQNGTDVSALRAQVAIYQTITGLLAVRNGDVAGSVTAYRRAVELQPLNPTYSRNYSIVLSDTVKYAEAIAETQRLITQLRGQTGNEQTIAQAEQLIALFERVRGGK
ncbi:MAG: hypothetical protein WCP31_02960 [Chloroflexales bacterium]